MKVVPFAEYRITFSLERTFFDAQPDKVLDGFCEKIDEVASPEDVRRFIEEKLKEALIDYDFRNFVIEVNEV